MKAGDEVARPRTEQVPSRPPRGLGDGDLSDMGSVGMVDVVRDRQRAQRDRDSRDSCSVQAPIVLFAGTVFRAYIESMKDE